ncbi:MAG TPA: hypothetical protein P5123_06385 [Spirochaetota bacterium]|nr:hypothetical protein [Spirochaetota bacterium]
MSKIFGDSEKYILKNLNIGNIFIYGNEKYIIRKSGKPTCSSGEPKTDIYIQASNLSNSKIDIEIKISYKQNNADFLENKMTAKRAKQILGPDWKKIIIKSTKKLQKEFKKRPLIYKDKHKKTARGCFTLGWKFELLLVKSGNLSYELELSQEQVHDIYSGKNLSADKKDSLVNGEQILNSGIANFILKGDVSSYKNTQDIIDNIIIIDKYIQENPNIYYACKALNYRSFKDKWDGPRPLAVYVNWTRKRNKLHSEIIFKSPLSVNGNLVANQLKNVLMEMNIKNTNDITNNNCYFPEIIYNKIE